MSSALAQSLPLSPPSTRLATDRAAIESHRAVLLHSGHPSIPFRRAMQYAVLGQGQRFRPILALRIARLCGHENAFTLRAAAAVEFIHCASLIIDDLPCMDNADTRRNRPATHVAFGQATALLSAFGLVALAARSVVEQPCPPTQVSSLIRFQCELLRTLDASGLCEGQDLDLKLDSAQRLEWRHRINELKTVPLFLLAAEAGLVFTDPDSASALPRIRRVTTMRCVSNTLKSNLMGTAEWSGIFLRQLIDPTRVPAAVCEVALLGADGHDDSIPATHALSEELPLSLGMNGRTLDRVHGFPFRLIAPRYYGFKSVKWLAEIRLVTRPYSGTWPRLGYTKEPIVHTMSFVDRVVRDGERLHLGGVSFAGLRGTRRVLLRAGNQPWVEASLETPLSPFSWTRWKGELVAPHASFVEARALDGTGRWQPDREKPQFPDGVAGPTVKSIP